MPRPPSLRLGTRPRLSRETKTLAMIASLIACALLLVVGSLWVTERERRSIEADERTLDQLWSHALHLQAASRDEEVSVAAYLVSADPGAEIRYRTAVGVEAGLLATIDAAADELPQVRLAGALVLDARDAWQTDYADPIINGGRPDVGAEAAHGARLHAALQTLTDELNRAHMTLDDRVDGLSAARLIGTSVSLAVLLLATLIALRIVRRDGHRIERLGSRADILNRFTEVTVFAPDDAAIATANLEALALLVHPESGVVHVLNHSEDRAEPLAALGDRPTEVLAMSDLSRCPGIMRGSIHVTPDVTMPLSVHCPVFPVAEGTVACIPLSHGETVGAAHLHWTQPGSLSLEHRPALVRIAEHAALAIGNRRLLHALKGQANTDARTGLANSRSFDDLVDTWLGGRSRADRATVLMLDLDHFKDFNDRHGHPAGDEALKVFADVMRACIRDGDIAARYGGEEFAVFLPGLDVEAGLHVAERIRARTEATIIQLGPGTSDRLTVSVGVAAAPEQGDTVMTLLREADRALYHAKNAGRNRVAYLGAEAEEPRDVPVVRKAGPRRKASAA